MSQIACLQQLSLAQNENAPDSDLSLGTLVEQTSPEICSVPHNIPPMGAREWLGWATVENAFAERILSVTRVNSVLA
jgi:hypothetical protein